MAVSEILRQFAPDCGVCAFETIAAHLLPCRAATRLPADPQSILLLIFPYRFPETPARDLSRYACVPDYHTAAGRVLETAAAALQTAYPQHTFVSFIDNSPIPEVRAAAHAGLGCIGENGLLLHPVYGSFVFIGEVVTDLLLPPTGGALRYCENCGACAAACPGACLPGTDRDTCVSAISQKKGTLTPEEAARLQKGGLVWGCDTCQDVCPHNRAATIAPHPCFDSYTPCYLPDDCAFATRAYSWRGRAVPERNRQLLYQKT